MVFVLGRDTPVRFSQWHRLREAPDAKLILEENDARRWKMRLQDWEANFPGFTAHYERCQLLGMTPVETTAALKLVLQPMTLPAVRLPDLDDMLTP